MQNEFLNIFSQIPTYIFWKDCDLVFRGGNQLFAEAAGLKSVEEIPGKSDYDLPWANCYADLYRQRDRAVMAASTIFQGRELQLQASGKTIQVLVRKSPLYDKGALIGVVGSYIAFADEPQLYLPAQQTRCLHYLTKGLTAKQIAKEMRLSVRTIEYYISILKKKFGCHNSTELISKITKLW